jgi:hypothetical protein
MSLLPPTDSATPGRRTPSRPTSREGDKGSQLAGTGAAVLKRVESLEEGVLKRLADLEEVHNKRTQDTHTHTHNTHSHRQ